VDIALIIGIPVVIILAAITVLASARRRSSDAQGRTVGRLGAETKASDSSALAVTDDTSDEARARADETKATATGVATRGKTSLAEMAPADYEEIQVSRRQFFNRSIITTMAISIGAFGAAAISFLYAKSAGGFGGKVDAGVGLADAQAYWAANKAPYYVPEARTYLQPYPTQDVAKAKKVPEYALVIPGMEQGSSPSTRSACTSAAASRGARRRNGSSAPATARSTAGSARRRVGRHRAGSTTSSRRSPAARSRSTPGWS
jgi:hypothetical protein